MATTFFFLLRVFQARVSLIFSKRMNGGGWWETNDPIVNPRTPPSPPDQLCKERGPSWKKKCGPFSLLKSCGVHRQPPSYFRNRFLSKIPPFSSSIIPSLRVADEGGGEAKGKGMQPSDDLQQQVARRPHCLFFFSFLLFGFFFSVTRGL